VPQLKYEDWLWGLKEPGLLPEAYFVALHSDNYIGLRELWTDSAGTSVLGGLLGVLPDYRQRGIGLAMQLRGIAYAKEQGYHLLKTCTGSANAPMQALFNKLGFGRDPEWLQCQKDL
jgi:GNAT superfamily N-acetyltransferase